MLVKKNNNKKTQKQSTHESPIKKRKNLFVSKASATFIGRLRCGDMQVDGWMDRWRRFEQVCMTYILLLLVRAEPPPPPGTAAAIQSLLLRIIKQLWE